MKLAVAGLFLVAFPDGLPADFHQDFRGQAFDPQVLQIMGPEAAARIRSEPEGLRITLPAEQQRAEHVGLITTFPIKGDFEITLRYEILHADRPKTGNGVGLEFYLKTETPTAEALGFYRVRRVREGDVFMLTRATTTAEGKRRHTHELIPSAANAGQLRMTRTGTEATWWAAEGDDGEFRELHRDELGAEDVSSVLLTAYPGKAQCAVDLRLIEFRVRSGKAPTAAERAGIRPRRIALWVTAGVSGALLILGGIWAQWRRRLPRQPGAAGAGPTAPATAAASLLFPCSTCGKNLKAKPESAGKNVKCPQCGGTMLVPGTQSG
ncbi:MAG: DUF1583 domain-containing protein [Gemmataceae bacterium]|nr:DUF1583 domain-containing protein [Gemmataceae bacterium]